MLPILYIRMYVYIYISPVHANSTIHGKSEETYLAAVPTLDSRLTRGAIFG